MTFEINEKRNFSKIWKAHKDAQKRKKIGHKKL